MCRSVYSASKMYMRHAVVRFDVRVQKNNICFLLKLNANRMREKSRKSL